MAASTTAATSTPRRQRGGLADTAAADSCGRPRRGSARARAPATACAADWSAHTGRPPACRAPRRDGPARCCWRPEVGPREQRAELAERQRRPAARGRGPVQERASPPRADLRPTRLGRAAGEHDAGAGRARQLRRPPGRSARPASAATARWRPRGRRPAVFGRRAAVRGQRRSTLRDCRSARRSKAQALVGACASRRAPTRSSWRRTSWRAVAMSMSVSARPVRQQLVRVLAHMREPQRDRRPGGTAARRAMRSACTP